jgi:hypothetical protein
MGGKQRNKEFGVRLVFSDRQDDSWLPKCAKGVNYFAALAASIDPNEFGTGGGPMKHGALVDPSKGNGLVETSRGAGQ